MASMSLAERPADVLYLDLHELPERQNAAMQDDHAGRQKARCRPPLPPLLPSHGSGGFGLTRCSHGSFKTPTQGLQMHAACGASGHIGGPPPEVGAQVERAGGQAVRAVPHAALLQHGGQPRRLACRAQARVCGIGRARQAGGGPAVGEGSGSGGERAQAHIWKHEQGCIGMEQLVS